MNDEHSHLIQFADSAVQVAKDVRKYHAKRTKVGSATRNQDIMRAVGQVQAAMRPIRSALGRAPYDDITPDSEKRLEELREASRRLQVERRKLWKLRNGGSKKRGPRGGRRK